MWEDALQLEGTAADLIRRQELRRHARVAADLGRGEGGGKGRLERGEGRDDGWIPFERSLTSTGSVK